MTKRIKLTKGLNINLVGAAETEKRHIDNGKFYKNTIEAGKDLYLSCSAIGLICNGKVKNPSVRVRWAKEVGELL